MTKHAARLLTVVLLTGAAGWGQRFNELARKAGWPYLVEVPPGLSRHDFSFPDAAGFRVFNGDFHIHTIYSDGQVTPETRVVEAWRDGLDVLAITDHAEYIDIAIPEQKERAYGRAKALAQRLGLTLLLSSEVSTAAQVKRPPANSDFIVTFLRDEAALNQEFAGAMKTARSQDAISIWAHPGASWTSSSLRFREEKWLHGVELFNAQVALNRRSGLQQIRGVWLWPNTMAWADLHHLAVFAVSDAHWPIDLLIDARSGHHRPMTLLLAKSAEPTDIREAIDQRRTIACFGNMLWGPQSSVDPLVRASLHVTADSEAAGVRPVHSIRFENRAPIPFYIRLSSDNSGDRYPDGEVLIPAASSVHVAFTPGSADPGDLIVDIANVFIGPEQSLRMRDMLIRRK